MPEEDEAEAQPVQTTCAGCRTLRRRCVPGCVFAPYFPAEGDDTSRFAAVHRVFGASNVARMLEDVSLPSDRRRAAETLVEEARARVRDPALGCVSYVAVLQMLNEKAREQVDAVREEIAGELGAGAAAEPVDVAAAEPAARVEARAQAERALAHARERDAELLAVRNAADLEWWRQQRQAEKHAAGGRNTNEQVAETENTAAAAAAKGESSSEQTMVMTQAEAGTELDSTEGNGYPRQQMAETEEPAPAAVAASERAMLTPPAAAVDQRHHLAAPHAGTEPSIPGIGHLQQKVLEDKQSSTAAAEAAREEAMASGQAPAAAPQHHESAATQLAGAGTGFLDGEQWAAAEALAKELDTMRRRYAAAQQHHHPAAAHYASMGLHVTPRLQKPPHQQAAAAAEVASGQDSMATLAQQIAEAEAEAAAEQDMMMQLLAAGAPQYGNLAAQYDVDAELDVTLAHGHQDMRQQMTELGTLGHEPPQEIVQQLAAAAKVAMEQRIMPQIATAELAGEQETIMQQVAAAAELAREQELIVQQARQQEMAMLLQASAAPMAQYSETELGVSLGHQPLVQQLLQEQQLADAVGVAGEPNTTTVVQHVAAYADAKHGRDSGATAAFRPPGLSEAAPFLVEQSLQGQTARVLGLQMGSSLPPLGQPHAQASQQQGTDGGDDGQSSDLTAYLYY
ncbi:hypothetical protein SEVIR_2G043200v4 [Setaria viridis]|uniref:uncharacterized protein n=1 Tax=Setaria viridis TaxID=4556 RepID=UPI001493B030|nr:uncharacterized protein LOC117843963 [Setaria viridis]